MLSLLVATMLQEVISQLNTQGSNRDASNGGGGGGGHLHIAEHGDTSKTLHTRGKGVKSGQSWPGLTQFQLECALRTFFELSRPSVNLGGPTVCLRSALCKSERVLFVTAG